MELGRQADQKHEGMMSNHKPLVASASSAPFFIGFLGFQTQNNWQAEEIRHSAETAIHASDPCIRCTVHISVATKICDILVEFHSNTPEVILSKRLPYYSMVCITCQGHTCIIWKVIGDWAHCQAVIIKQSGYTGVCQRRLSLCGRACRKTPSFDSARQFRPLFPPANVRGYMQKKKSLCGYLLSPESCFAIRGWIGVIGVACKDIQEVTPSVLWTSFSNISLQLPVNWTGILHMCIHKRQVFFGVLNCTVHSHLFSEFSKFYFSSAGVSTDWNWQASCNRANSMSDTWTNTRYGLPCSATRFTGTQSTC